MPNTGFDTHDHSACITQAMQAAQDHCSTRKLQFTKIRRRVLEILLMQHRAMGAYDILEQLAAEGQNAQPPVAYRALDFLVSNGFAHKIQQLNAYIACAHPGGAHTPAFLICRACNGVAETCLARGNHPPAGLFAGAARDMGFAIETAVIEASGLCPACQQQESPCP
jgi:Fur family zinc uptake transcriptional regulator